MNLLKLHQHNNYHRNFSSISRNSSSLAAPHFLIFPTTHRPKISPLTLNYFLEQRNVKASVVKIQTLSNKEEENSEECEYLAADGVVYKKTLRLVEGAMFAAVSGLAYLLSNSLAIENYLGCFFALPIVISSMRWGAEAGRKTMVATVVLLFVLSGPVKALNYMLMHGLLGFTMGSLWRSRTNWGASIFLCSLARAVGALGYVILSSFLIGENILALITVNIHASLSYILTSIGSQIVPSMNFIYTLFGTLILQCVNTVSYSLQINGEAMKPFLAAKGLQQGDPISPYLFAISMEYFRRILQGLKQQEKFKFHPGCGN